MELPPARASIPTHAHTLVRPKAYSQTVFWFIQLIPSCMFEEGIWPVMWAVTPWRRDMNRTESSMLLCTVGRKRCSTLRSGVSPAVSLFDSRGGVGGRGRQSITLSPVQYVRLDGSSVTAEVALQEWHALCLCQNDQVSAVSGPSQPERSYFFPPSPKTLFSLGCF